MSHEHRSSKKARLSYDNDNGNANANANSAMAATDKNITALDLPPELWATKILGFLSMDDILSCSIVDKSFFLEQVSPMVKRLVVTNSANLRVAPHALQKKRFKRVSGIKIFCLFKNHENPNICAETCRHLVQFLSCFPRLFHVDLSAGKRVSPDIPEIPFVSYYEPKVRTKKNCEVLGNLLDQLCNAFSTGQLRSSVAIRGLQYMCGSIEKRQDCRCCRTMCYSFPIEQVTNTDFGAPCLDVKDRLEIALSRDMDGMKQTSTLDTLLSQALERRNKGILARTRCGDAVVILDLPDDHIDYMNWLIQKGANPRLPQLKKNLTTWKKWPNGKVPFGFHENDPTALRRMDLKTFQNLIRLGMDLPEKDFKLIKTRRPKA